MELHQYRVIELRNGQKTLKGRLGSASGPLWDTSAIKQVKGDFVVTSTDKVYKLASRCTDHEQYNSLETQSMASHFASECTADGRDVDLDVSVPAADLTRTPECSQRPQAQMDGVFKVPAPILTPRAKRNGRESLSDFTEKISAQIKLCKQLELTAEKAAKEHAAAKQVLYDLESQLNSIRSSDSTYVVSSPAQPGQQSNQGRLEPQHAEVDSISTEADIWDHPVQPLSVESWLEKSSGEEGSDTISHPRMDNDCTAEEESDTEHVERYVSQPKSPRLSRRDQATHSTKEMISYSPHSAASQSPDLVSCNRQPALAKSPAHRQRSKLVRTRLPLSPQVVQSPVTVNSQSSATARKRTPTSLRSHMTTPDTLVTQSWVSLGVPCSDSHQQVHRAKKSPAQHQSRRVCSPHASSHPNINTDYPVEEQRDTERVKRYVSAPKHTRPSSSTQQEKQLAAYPRDIDEDTLLSIPVSSGGRHSHSLQSSKRHSSTKVKETPPEKRQKSSERSSRQGKQVRSPSRQGKQVRSPRRTSKKDVGKEMAGASEEDDAHEADLERVWSRKELHAFDSALLDLPATEYSSDYDFWIDVSRHVRSKSWRECSQLFQQRREKKKSLEREARAARRATGRPATCTSRREQQKKTERSDVTYTQLQPANAHEKEIVPKVDHKARRVVNSERENETVENTPPSSRKLAGKKTLKRREQMVRLVDKVNEGYSPDVFDSTTPFMQNKKRYAIPNVQLTPHNAQSRGTVDSERRRHLVSSGNRETPDTKMHRQRKEAHRLQKALPLNNVWPVTKTARVDSHSRNSENKQPDSSRRLITEHLMREEQDEEYSDDLNMSSASQQPQSYYGYE